MAGRVYLPECLLAEARVAESMGDVVEHPTLIRAPRLRDRHRDRVGQSLQDPEDQRAMGPRTGERDEEVVAIGLGLEAAFAGRTGDAVGGHPIADDRPRTLETTIRAAR